MRCSLALVGSLALALGACADAATDRNRRPTPAAAEPAPAAAHQAGLTPEARAALTRTLDELDERVQRLDDLLAERRR